MPLDPPTHREDSAGNQVQAQTAPSTRIALTHSQPAPSAVHTRTVRSSPPLASQVPSGAIATAFTPSVWPVRVARRVPSAPHTRTLRSSPPLASQVPSGAIATPLTLLLWPVRVARAVPSGAQIRTVPSSLPVASQVPSGAIATALNQYERLAARHETYVYWSMIIVMTRRLARPG